MSLVCIPKEIGEKIKAMNLNVSSKEREKLFSEFMDPTTAKDINKLYEKSTLLKNQEKAMDNFLKDITGVNAEKKAAMRKKMQAEIQRKREMMYNPDGSVNENFQALAGRTDEEVNEYAKKVFDNKYDIDIDDNTIGKIVALRDETQVLKNKIGSTPDGSPERLAYGRKVVEMSDIIDGLKNPRNNMGIMQTIADSMKEATQRFSKDKGITGNIGAGVKLTSDILTSAVYKSVQASMDMSYALRQGFKVLTKNPKVWGQNFVEAFKPFLKMTSKKEMQAVANEFKARLVSSKMYEDAMASGLNIGVVEDFFPTTVAEKVPALGNIFKASNEAFTIFSQGARMGLFEDMVTGIAKNGTEMTPALMKDIAKVANSISGRGSLGRLEASSGIVNKIFYSGRFIKSQLDTFTLPFSPGLAPAARAEALKSSLANLSAIAGLMTAASMFTEVEFDPRSSKFGKAKIPGSDDTWVDLTAGLGSYVTLATRQIRGESKSAGGSVTDLTSGKFGAPTRFSAASDWLTGKLSPAPSTLVSYLKGKDYSGKKPTVLSSARNLVTPISAGNMYSVFTDEQAGTALLSTMFDVLGASGINYNRFK